MSTQRKMQALMPLLKSPREGRENLVKRIAEQHKVSSRSLWRWLREFEARGSRAFSPKPRADKGRSRFFDAHPDRAIQVYNLWAQSWPAKAIHAALDREMLVPPSLDTVRAFVRSIDSVRPQ